jgi:adenylate cyclase
MILQDASLLVVDDNDDNRYTLTRRLKREGYANISTANDGLQALEQLQQKKFDLVMLDVMMPEMNGYEVLERMKSDPQLRDIPVIMITAVEDQESVIRCIKLGAEDHLPKPFDATLLTARVSASLEKKRLRDELHELNRTLEARVQEQLSELDRLGLLKRFFSPQIAKTILDTGGEKMLRTHRSEVVVVFLDMRGFTAFTDKAEPEEVMEVLSEYHNAMGPLIFAEEGTLDRFTGDGMMIYFNDPIKMESPLASAVRMSLAMQRDFVPLREAWRKRGFNLDLGIGIAQGYATLGAIGFEGRWDYTCIGSVTNHAARLCGEAKGGQILTNGKTHARVEALVKAEPLGDMNFKGVAEPVPVVNITGLAA